MRLLHSNVIGVYEVCARVCVLVCFEGGGGGDIDISMDKRCLISCANVYV